MLGNELQLMSESYFAGRPSPGFKNFFLGMKHFILITKNRLSYTRLLRDHPELRKDIQSKLFGRQWATLLYPRQCFPILTHNREGKKEGSHINHASFLF